MGEWFEDEGFWEVSYDSMFPSDAIAPAAAKAKQLIALTGLESGDVLDLCCGPGRYAVPLASEGLRVTGVDLSAYLLSRGRQYADDNRVDVEWVECGMDRFVRDGAFDLALNLNTSFGFFEDPADNQRVLDNVYTSLRAGGLFVLETMGKEVLARVYEPTGSSVSTDGSVRFERREVIDDWSRIENVWTFVRDGRAVDYRVRHWLFSGRELRLMLEAAGFGKVRLAGDYSGSPYGPAAPRLVAIAKKTRDD